jgi:hypothetical protein
MSPTKESLDDILAAHAGPPRASSRERLSDAAFAESKHQYTDPRTGKRLVSVTSVVGAFDSGDKLGRGAAAAAKITAAGGDYRKEWDEKSDTGTRVHGYAELWLNGKTADVPEEDAAHMDQFVGWCDEHRPEWVVTEASGVGYIDCPAGPCGVCDFTGRIGYGGRFDGIGFWDDHFWMSDFKTGKSYRPELTLQLAGYANFDGLIRYDEAGTAVGLDPLPHVDRWCGIYIHADDCYSFECPDPKKEMDDWTIEQMQSEAFKAFSNLLFVKEWGKQINRKGR